MNYPEKGTTGIYKITSPSGRVYIGQSICIANRWRHYINYDCSEQPKLYNSLIKHKSENHIFEIIEVCVFEDLNIKERHWQEFYDAVNHEKGLNCVLTNTKDKPKKLSQEVKDKISKSNSGENHWTTRKPYTEQHRKNLSIAGKGKRVGEKNPNFGKKGVLSYSYGRKHSPEARKKLSDSHMGHKHTPETIQKLKDFHKGRTWKKEDIEKRNRSKKEKTVILNLETGIYYMGYEEAGDTIGMKADYLANRLRGSTKNNTSFILCYNKYKVFL